MIGKALGHYRIVEKLGAGGMGEVYRAHDEHLQRDVAIKVLPSGTLADEQARKRFRNEALALSRLNHSGIEAVYDFDTEDKIDFLVVEYAPGTTLWDCLASGPIPEEEVVKLGLQITSALQEAHENGVVHRDLKPANIVLTPKKQIKVLDFGLAKLLRPASASATTESLTETRGITGTLPYMAPEQLRGEPVDARTDLWAVGAILYEMATGRHPFPEPTAPLLIDAILNKPPQPPAAFDRQISSGLQRVILKALEKDPDRRYQSSHDLGADLGRLATGVVRPALVPRRRAWVATVAGVIVLLGGASLLWHFQKRGGKLAQSVGVPVRARRSVAVLGFKNLSGRADTQWLSTALSEMLTTELAAGELLRTVPGENVARMRIDLSLPDADSYSPDTLGRIHGMLNANYVVLGSYLDLGKASGGDVRLDMRLQDTGAGETLAQLSVRGTETQLDELVSRAGTDLRRKLGAQEVAASEAGAVRAVLPSGPEAARLYSEGLAKLRTFDAPGARDLLEKAVAAEPDYPLAHSALAAAWTSMGYDENAKREAERAFDLSAQLSREERLSVEARYRQTTNDWDRVIEIYRTLFNFSPDNLDYGLQLARAQSSAGKGKEALATIEVLRKFPPPERGDPRIDLAEGVAARSLGDFHRIEASAAQAVVKGQTQGSQLVVAQARADQCTALRHLGEPKKATSACEEARRIYAAAGDRGGVAMVLNNLANIVYERGDLTGAKKLYEEALAAYRQIGNKHGAAGALDNLANVMGDLGDLAGARKLSEEALKMYQEVSDYTGIGETLNNIAAGQMIVGDFEGAMATFQKALDIWHRVGNRSGLATTLQNLAEMLLSQGDLPQAKSRYLEALSIFGETGQKGLSAYPLTGLADVLFVQGDLASAKLKYEEVVAICRESADKHQCAFALFGLGSVLAHQGDLTAARRRHEEALAIRKELGEKASEAQSILALAELDLEEGHTGEAETLVGKALEEFHAEKLRDDEIMARSILARSLLVRHKVAEAGRQIDLAADFVRRSHIRAVRMKYAIMAARVRAAKGAKSDAVKSLNGILAEATKYGYRSYQLESRLRLGEIEIASGQTISGRSRLETLEKDANSNGFLLIARKAAKAKG